MNGNDTAGALLLTVLGELVLPAGGRARTASLIGVLGGLGVDPPAARQALGRAARRGWLGSERRGREAVWHLSGAGIELLTTGAQRIYSFGAGRRRWDGRWLVLIASVPESRRSLRHRLRRRLNWAGLAGIAPGVWITPRAERMAEVSSLLRDLGLHGATCVVGTLGDVGDPAALVAQAWNLGELAEAYRGFIDDHRRAAPAAPDAVTVALLRMVHAWRRFPYVDPDLPAELLPAGWPRAGAAALFAERRARWSPVALRRWAELEPVMPRAG